MAINKNKVQLQETVLDANGHPLASTDVNPLTSSDCVIMENGMTLEDVMGNDTVIDTPTIMNEDTSFRAGIGDSETKVIDSDVAKMVIEGKTYQNILPKPTTLIMNTDEKEFKINDKIDSSIVLDDNVAEIATVKGQTYVNVVQEESASEYVAIDEELNGQSITTTGKPEGYVKNATLEGLTLVNTIQEPSGADATVLDLDADIDAQYATIDNTVQGGIHGAKLNGMTLVNLSKINQFSLTGANALKTTTITSMIKPNTKYTRILVITENTLTDSSSIYVAQMQYGRDTQMVCYTSGAEAQIATNFIGVAQKRVFTTPDDLSTYDNMSGIRIFSTNSGGTLKGYEIILEGDYTNIDIPYFEGMQSVEAPSVKTTGKNLFDVTKISNKITISSLNNRETFIPNVNSIILWENTYNESGQFTITIAGYNNGTTHLDWSYRIRFSYTDGTMSSDTQYISSKEKVVTSASNKIVKNIIIDNPWNVNNYHIYIDSLQIEESSTATSYEPYQSSTVTMNNILLIDGGYTNGYLDDRSTLITTTVDFHTNDFTPIKPNTELVTNASTLYYYDENKNWIGRARQLGYTAPSNARYIKAQWGVEYTINDLWVRENVQLRKVGDVQDELDLETGKLTQRIGEIVLDGSQQELSVDISRDNTVLIIFNSTKTGLSTGGVCICDKLPFKANSSEDFEHMRINANGNVCFWINKTKFEELNVAGVKKYLLQNPITVQYPLVTESTKTIDLQVTDQDNKSIKTIQTHPTLTHISTSSQGLIPNIVIPSQLKYPTIIKPSTTYTVQLKQTTVNSEFPLTTNLGGTTMAVPSTKFTITTPSELTSQDVIFTGKNNVIGEVVITEGDTTGIEYGFFEGMNDVKSPSVYATGKNLFDKNNYTEIGGSRFHSSVIGGENVPTSTGDANHRWMVLKLPIGGTYSIELNKQNTNPSGWINAVVESDVNTITKGEIYRTIAYEIHNATKNTKHTFTTTKPYVFIHVGYNPQYNQNKQELLDSIMLNVGSTATSYEPYKGATIEQDIDSIPLTSDMFEQGNLNGDNVIKGMSYQQVPIIDGTNRICSKTLIKVKPNCTYTLQSDNIKMWMMAFDKNGGYIKNMELSNTITTDANTYYLGLKLQYNDDSNITPSDLNSLNLTLQEVTDEIVLRSIGDVKDTLNLTTGEYVQRIKEVILNGSEDWRTISTWDSENHLAFIYYLKGNVFKSIDDVKCDKLVYRTWADLNSKDIQGMTLGRGTDDYIVLKINKSLVSDLVSFKTWLQNNDITVQYKLATPIIKKVNLTNTTKLPSYTSTTHYDTIVPSNSLVPNIKIPSTIDYNVAIKPSTQYTVRCNTTDALSVNLGGSTGTLANGKVVLTTPSTLAHNSLKLGNGKVKELMVIEGNEIKDNVPFFNGMKNVQMGGIKLVNIARISKISASVTANANKTQFTFTPNQTSWGHIVFDNTLLKPNTKYTVFINIIKNDLQPNADNVLKIQLRQTDASRCSYVKKGFTGLHKVLMTTVDEDKFNSKDFGLFFIDTDSDSSKQMIIQNPMIIEGDWTHLDEIPYIESEMIIEQPIIRSTSEDGVEPFKQHTLSSNRVIGYEEGCYYAYGGGTKTQADTINSVMADVEELSVAYVTGGSSNYTFWDKDDIFISGKQYLDTSLSSYDKNGFITVPSNAKYMRFAAGGETNSQPLYKVATVTGELPLRSLPNGVCDTFNLVTGEYVQRVGEVVLDGVNIKPKWIVQPASNDVTSYFDFEEVFTGAKTGSYAFSHKFIYEDYLYNDDRTRYAEGIRIGSDGWGSIRIFNTRLKTVDKNGFVAWLKENPITVQYELETPIVRKIGLTAKGNYREIELNGSERVGQNPEVNKMFHIYGLDLANDGQAFTLFTNNEQFTVTNSRINYTIYKYKNGSDLVLTMDENINTLDLFKRWLSQNPIKVGHLTNNSSSLYSNIQKPIFFNNVKVQFMNDNVDIQPTLTLQARSMNSYVMNMMKANTRYTLKALANPNPFTIDGTSYGAGTNGTFTSPSTLTNKLLITGLYAQELMIIEGDVTGKTIPYYKGIRSAYNDVDRVEIHSANKNLLPKEFHNRCFGEATQQIARICSKMIECKPNTVYTVYNIPSDFYTDVYVEYANDYAEFDREVITTKRVEIASYGRRSKITFTTPIGYKYMAIYIFSGSGFTQDGYNYTNAKISLCLGTLDDYTYQPHKENTTIINMPMQLETVEVVRPVMEEGRIDLTNGTLQDNYNSQIMVRNANIIPVQPNDYFYCRNGQNDRYANIVCYDINKNFICYYTQGSKIQGYLPNNCYFINFYIGKNNYSDLTITIQRNKPIQLNSLPNGVKDELIINRATSSAKLIRRVGKVVLDGSESWWINQYYKKTTQFIVSNFVKAKNATRQEVVCDKLQSVTDNYVVVDNSVWIFNSNNLVIHHSSSTINQLKDYLKQNPLTVYYELAEPVITEIRLKGYPFIYEDGSISLNTDIAPVTRTSYNVNQHQLINSQNETIIRHDKQISDLYDYIEIYLDEIYRMELFKMQLELSL